MLDTKAVLQVARGIQGDADSLRVGKAVPGAQVVLEPKDFMTLYDALVTFDRLRDASRKLYADGHYARAVEEAYKCLNNRVKARSRLALDGQELMQRAFTEKDPLLRLNSLRTVSEKDEQAGYMMIFAGCVRGIRNPRAHEHDIRDEPAAALEMLVLANHLLRVVGQSTRTRRRKKTP